MANNYHSQNNEATIVINYFKGRKGTLLDIGANDAITFSNSYDLIALGWKGILIEPSSVFTDIAKVHSGNKKVSAHNLGIGLKEEEVTFYESGNHVPNGIDKCLVSTIYQHETIRWRRSGVQFTERKVKLIPFTKLWYKLAKPKLNFISIDVEGMEFEILQQIDLNQVGCEVLCIEWNSVPMLDQVFADYCNGYGMFEIHRNAENIIFAR